MPSARAVPGGIVNAISTPSMSVAASHQRASHARTPRTGPAIAPPAAGDAHALSPGTRRTDKQSGLGIGIDWDRSGSFLEAGVEEAVVVGGQAVVAGTSAASHLVFTAGQHLAGRLQSYRIC